MFATYGLYYIKICSFYVYFLKSFYHKWVLNIVKSFICFYWDDRMIFVLQFVNIVYHIDWFSYIEEFLHPWDKSHLIMAYNPFNVLLDSIHQNFVEDICICFHQWYWSVIFFSGAVFVWFWYQGDCGLIIWVWEFSESWSRIGVSSSLNMW